MAEWHDLPLDLQYHIIFLVDMALLHGSEWLQTRFATIEYWEDFHRRLFS